MKRAALLGLCILAANARAQDAGRIFEAVRATVVSVEVREAPGDLESQGSGVVVGAGRVVTNCHVLEGGRSVTVTPDRGKPLGATLILRDREHDLCILEVSQLSSRAAGLRDKEPALGERLYSVGNPLGFGLAVGSGLLTAYKGEGEGRRLIVTAPLSPGSSGGGIFDERGLLVGISTSAYFLGQSLGVAVPAGRIRELELRGERVSTEVRARPDPDWAGEAERLRQSQDWNNLAVHAKRWLSEYPSSPSAVEFWALAQINLGQLELARELLLQAVRKEPLRRNLRAYLGLAYLRLGDLAAAEQQVRAGLQAYAAEGYLWTLLGDIQRANGKLDEARKSFRNALRLDPSLRPALLNLAQLEFREKSWDEVIRLNRILLRLGAEDAAVRRSLAAALAAKGLPDETGAALVAVPGGMAAPQAWVLLGHAQVLKGRYPEAERAFRTAIEINPADAEAWSRLGGVLAQTNRNAEAEKAFREALSLKPDVTRAAFFLGKLLLARKQNTEALQWLSRASETEPQALDVWRMLGALRVQSGDWANAVVAYEKLTALDGKSAADWAVLADAQMRLGRMEAGRAASERALQIDAQNATALTAAGAYHGRSGDNAKALDYLERALKISPGSAGTWNSKGYALLKLGRLDEAVEALRTALRLAPDFVAALTNLGEAHVARKEPGIAIRYLERSLKLSPSATDARLYLAKAYVLSGQAEVAKQQIEPLLGQDTTEVEVAYTAAEVYVLLGDEKVARAWYARLYSLSPARAKDLLTWQGVLGEKSRKLRLEGDVPSR